MDASARKAPNSIPLILEVIQTSWLNSRYHRDLSPGKQTSDPHAVACPPTVQAGSTFLIATKHSSEKGPHEGWMVPGCGIVRCKKTQAQEANSETNGCDNRILRCTEYFTVRVEVDSLNPPHDELKHVEIHILHCFDLTAL